MSAHSAPPLVLSTAEANDLRNGRTIRGDDTMWHRPRHSAETTPSDLDVVRDQPIHLRKV